jgi:heat shock protein HtpX
MKRVILFVLTNFLVMITISILLSVLGVNRYLSAAGINYEQLAIFCLIWGMAGSLVSLALSKVSAKWTMGLQVVDKRSADTAWLVLMVEDLARKAGLSRTPEVAIYDSPEVNAFATGPTKNNSLVAFSTGLLHSMNRSEIEGVAGHEIAHIANGDMVTMTLLQGVVNAFVMFFARVIAFAVSQNTREENRYALQYTITMLLEMVLGLLGMIVVCWFSRWREFRADRGGAQYAGKNDMIAALERLAANHRMYDQAPSLATLKISGGVGVLFSTHPPLEKRIAALRAAA